ncbi:MAG TPA: galactokinase, partial [Candidatus Izemoplasmatales bacterium]|nr:galactokinase [Candidatus Izemoplasmatales bacterium]
MNFEFLKQYQRFLGNDYHIYFSPGRVNLIGEHIDYLGGKVFPIAISLGTYAFVSKREDNELHLMSHNFPQQGEVMISLDDLDYKEDDGWTNFFKGMFKTYKDKGVKYPFGLNILVYGTLPYSSGLSSSASIELLAGIVIKDTYKLGIKNIDLVLDAKDVENNYVGVACGIMDQFAIGMAKKGNAIYLDTNTLDYEQVSLDLKDYRLFIANSKVKRDLADSKYNERVKECEDAKAMINDHGFEINALCDLDYKYLKDLKEFLDVKLFNRVLHAISENIRTKDALSALKNHDFVSFGNLLFESHQSLKNLYEVSCLELDTLVDSFKNHGALGARMTGAGFGGCVMALCHKDDMVSIKEKVYDDYLNATGIKTDIYEVEPEGGP